MRGATRTIRVGVGVDARGGREPRSTPEASASEPRAVRAARDAPRTRSASVRRHRRRVRAPPPPPRARSRRRVGGRESRPTRAAGFARDVVARSARGDANVRASSSDDPKPADDADANKDASESPRLCNTDANASAAAAETSSDSSARDASEPRRPSGGTARRPRRTRPRFSRRTPRRRRRETRATGTSSGLGPRLGLVLRLRLRLGDDGVRLASTGPCFAAEHAAAAARTGDTAPPALNPPPRRDRRASESRARRAHAASSSDARESAADAAAADGRIPGGDEREKSDVGDERESQTPETSAKTRTVRRLRSRVDARRRARPRARRSPPPSSAAASHSAGAHARLAADDDDAIAGAPPTRGGERRLTSARRRSRRGRLATNAADSRSAAVAAAPNASRRVAEHSPKTPRSSRRRRARPPRRRARSVVRLFVFGGERESCESATPRSRRRPRRRRRTVGAKRLRATIRRRRREKSTETRARGPERVHAARHATRANAPSRAARTGVADERERRGALDDGGDVPVRPDARGVEERGETERGGGGGVCGTRRGHRADDSTGPRPTRPRRVTSAEDPDADPPQHPSPPRPRRRNILRRRSRSYFCRQPHRSVSAAAASARPAPARACRRRRRVVDALPTRRRASAHPRRLGVQLRPAGGRNNTPRIAPHVALGAAPSRARRTPTCTPPPPRRHPPRRAGVYRGERSQHVRRRLRRVRSGRAHGTAKGGGESFARDGTGRGVRRRAERDGEVRGDDAVEFLGGGERRAVLVGGTRTGGRDPAGASVDASSAEPQKARGRVDQMSQTRMTFRGPLAVARGDDVFELFAGCEFGA